MSKGPAKIIIEGTDYAQTKAISLALSEYPPFVGQKENHRYTTVISTKWGNFNDFPWGKGLVDFEPSQELQAMKNYGVWVCLIEMQGLYNWIIDRFHVFAQRYQIQNHKHRSDFTWLEERFLKLGFHLVHVVQNEAAIQQAILGQKNIGGDDQIETILQGQELSREIVSKSILPKFELDTSEMSIQETVVSITDWYEEVYAYTQPEHQEPEKIFLPSCA
jgi:hypothetical protein